MTTQDTAAPDLNAFPPDVPEGGLVVSASRLKKIGGEKGEPGCERKYAAEYCFAMRQSGSDATEFGSALHLTAEGYQADGTIDAPESRVGTVFRSGAHLVEACGKLLVEYEHVGMLPDGTPFTARLDGHSADGGETACIVIQDLKTTGRAERALVPGRGEKGILVDLQAMLYAWVLLCLPHWFAPQLPEGAYGPRHWQWWDPASRTARNARLRWLYFLTRGNPRAWDVSDYTTPAAAQEFLETRIMPLVARMRAIHEAHETGRDRAEGLMTYQREIMSCHGCGDWCGAGERDACQFEVLGTPALQLIQPAALLQKVTTTQMTAPANPNSARARLEALAARHGLPTTAPKAPEAAPSSPPPVATQAETGAAATDTPSEPKPAENDPAPTVAEQSSESTGGATPAEPSTSEPKAAGRGRRRTAPPAAPTGAGINPPEAAAALAALQPSDFAAACAALAALVPVGTSVTVVGVRS